MIEFHQTRMGADVLRAIRSNTNQRIRRIKQATHGTKQTERNQSREPRV